MAPDSFSRQTRSPETGGEVVYADVFAELDDIFETQDSESGSVAQLEDVVGDDLAEAAANKAETAPLDPFGILDQVVETMQGFTDQLQDAADIEEVDDVLEYRKNAFQEGIDELASSAEKALLENADAALTTVLRLAVQAENRLKRAFDGTEWNILDGVRRGPEPFLDKRLKLLGANVSTDCLVAFDRDLNVYITEQTDISRKIAATELASSDEAKVYFRAALDTEVLIDIKAQPGLEEMAAAILKTVTSPKENLQLMWLALNSQVFHYAKNELKVVDKIKSTELASSPEIGALMRAALDDDIFKKVLDSNSDEKRQELIDQASSPIEQDAMRRALNSYDPV